MHAQNSLSKRAKITRTRCNFKKFSQEIFFIDQVVARNLFISFYNLSFLLHYILFITHTVN